MAAPRSAQLWKSPNRVQTYYPASGTACFATLSELPKIIGVEATVCLITRRAMGEVSALSFFASKDDRGAYDVTARVGIFGSPDPQEAARRALAKATGLNMPPTPLKGPYVRVDYGSTREQSTLVFPYVLAVCQCDPARFPDELVPFEIEELDERARAARYADGGETFHPTLVHDVQLAMESLK